AQGIIQLNWQLGAGPLLDPPPGGCVLVVAAGTNVTLNSGVTNNPMPPPSYQWSYYGVPLPNATNSTLDFTPIQSSHAGSYSVVVSNAFGAAANICCVVVDPPLLRYQADLSGFPWLLNLSAAMLPGSIQVATNLLFPAAWQSVVTNITTNCNC